MASSFELGLVAPSVLVAHAIPFSKNEYMIKRKENERGKGRQ